MPEEFLPEQLDTEYSPDIEAFDLEEWENKPELQEFIDDYKAGASNKSKQVTKLDTWVTLHNPPLKDNLGATMSKLVPKSIKKVYEWRAASVIDNLLTVNNMFTSNPLGANDRELAEQEVNILNSQINSSKKIRFIEKFARTTISQGAAIIKLNWLFEDIELEDGTTQIIKNMPELQVISTRDFTVDPSVDDFDDASYYIEEYQSSVDLLIKKQMYSNLNRLKSRVLNQYQEDSDDSNNSKVNDKVTRDITTPSQAAREKITVKEYWGYYDVEDTGDLKLIKVSWALGVMIELKLISNNLLPYELCNYNPADSGIYGVPDAELLEENQEIIGSVTRGILNILARTSNGQVGVSEDFLNDAEKIKFNRGENYQYNPGNHPDRAIHIHKYEDIPQSALFMLQQQNSEIEALTGIKSFSNGIQGQSFGDTATGIRTAVDSIGKRENVILNRFAEVLNLMGRKIIKLNSVMLTLEEKAAYLDKPPVEYPINDDSLLKSISLTLNSPESEQAKAQNLTMLAQTLTPKLPPELSKVIVAEIMRLYNLPDLSEKLLNYQPEPTPQQQEMEKLEGERRFLEVEKLKAEIANEQAKAEENTVDVSLKQAKIGTELAKAKQLTVQADLGGNDLLNKLSGADDYNKGVELLANNSIPDTTNVGDT